MTMRALFVKGIARQKRIQSYFVMVKVKHSALPFLDHTLTCPLFFPSTSLPYPQLTDCNIPVHKDCYGVDQVPDGEWFCQKCENKRRNKPTRIRCCPMQTGAFKLTTKSGDFIHVVCARWNKSIDHQREPYDVIQSEIDKHECYKCGNKQGICIKCEEASCTRYFHVTCGVNAGNITITKNIPADYSPRCTEHQPQDANDKRPKKRYGSAPTRRRRRLLQKELIDSESSEGEDDMDEDDDHDEDHTEGDDDDDDDDDEDEDMGTSSSIRGKKRSSKSRSNSSIKRRAPSVPGRRMPAGPLHLFLSDQSDSDDHMGTSTTTADNKKSPAVTPRSDSSSAGNGHSPALSMKDRLEAKRRKSEVEKAKSASMKTASPSLALDTTKPSSMTTSTAAAPPSISQAAAATTTTGHQPMSSQPQPQPQPPSNGQPQPQPYKQKLPNKGHLMPSQRPPTPNGGGPKRFGSYHQPNTPTAPSGSVIKNLEEIETDILAQRRNVQPPSTPTTPAAPQPSIPHASTAFDDVLNGIERRHAQPDRKPSIYQGPRKSTTEGSNDATEYQKSLMRNKLMEVLDEFYPGSPTGPTVAELQQRLQAANQENQRMREENRRLYDFKRCVTDVFEGLHVRAPSGLSLSTDTVEEYVYELRSMLLRIGSLQENDMRRITDYVEDMVGRTTH
ncbi:hypothetical protein RO3G_15993 [Lichtheimia corymbifera JMRC:FSU:9682]|uniref:PHD-type domain-containing protein n=1 Tax=Lichtheimia corymbifera JMRC:FSU:9682 TaxID=1263082 RepID=A0A068S5M4_9FUNG|nr:hypothetical protein RO3G_15993 [Lichtheimia corymbifera JMRC:FSU:9682]